MSAVLLRFPQNTLLAGQAAVRQVAGSPNLASNNWPGQPGDPQSLNRSVSLPNPTLAGSLILNIGTLSNGGGVPNPPIYSDDVNGAWGTTRKLQQIDDSSGQQSMFMHAFPSSAAGMQVMSVTWDNLEWQGLLTIEVVNVSGAIIGSNKNTQDGHSGTVTDSFVTGTVACGGVKALLLAFSEVMLDNSVANGGSGLGRPNAGSSPWSSFGETWNLQGRENTSNANILMCESQFFASAGTVQGTFTPTGPDNYCSMVVAIPSN
jgi:hypothetical protein